MRAFFLGWKRKTGCVTLLMALAVAGLWMRTGVMVDSVGVRVADHLFAIWSCHDGHVLATWDRQPAPPPGLDQQGLIKWSWYSSKLNEMSPRYGDGSLSNILSWVKSDPPTMWDFAIHYQWLVLSLSILSASLILVKPKKKV